jgi:hypothetical protein
MLKLLIELLRVDDFYNVSENVDIAKGKYAIETSIKGIWKQEKRKRNGRKESN